MYHFTYKKPDKSSLKQGDLLEKTQEICVLLDEVHPHYLKDEYTHFIITTLILQQKSGHPDKSYYLFEC